MRCEFKRTKMWFGPRHGVYSKHWRCSRKATFSFKYLDKHINKIVEVQLCRQHVIIATKNMILKKRG